MVWPLLFFLLDFSMLVAIGKREKILKRKGVLYPIMIHLHCRSEQNIVNIQSSFSR